MILINFKVPVPLRKTVTIDSDFILSRRLRLCYTEKFMLHLLNYLSYMYYMLSYLNASNKIDSSPLPF